MHSSWNHIKNTANILIYRWHTGHCLSGCVGSKKAAKTSITYMKQYYKLRKFQDFQGPRHWDSSTFKHQPCFQVLSRPWIQRKKFMNFQGCTGTCAVLKENFYCSILNHYAELQWAQLAHGHLGSVVTIFCHWESKVLTVSFGCGNTRLPVDGLTVELSLLSDAMLALSRDSMESAEPMMHRRLTNGLLSEPATDECKEHTA